MIRKAIVLVLLILVTSNTFGTSQYPDILRFNGKQFYLFSNPMESYFNIYPEQDPAKVNHLDSSNSDQIVRCTALWRAYVATFEVLDNVLFLIDLEVLNPNYSYEDETSQRFLSIFEKIFIDQDRVEMSWFSGYLVFTDERRVYFTGSDNVLSRDDYWIVEVTDGNVMGYSEIRDSMVTSKSSNFTDVEYRRFLEHQREKFIQRE